MRYSLPYEKIRSPSICWTGHDSEIDKVVTAQKNQHWFSWWNLSTVIAKMNIEYQERRDACADETPIRKTIVSFFAVVADTVEMCLIRKDFVTAKKVPVRLAAANYVQTSWSKTSVCDDTADSALFMKLLGGFLTNNNSQTKKTLFQKHTWLREQ